MLGAAGPVLHAHAYTLAHLPSGSLALISPLWALRGWVSPRQVVYSLGLGARYLASTRQLCGLGQLSRPLCMPPFPPCGEMSEGRPRAMLPAGLRKAREQWGAGEQWGWPWKGSAPRTDPPVALALEEGTAGSQPLPLETPALLSFLAVPAAPCPLASSRAPPGLGAGWLGPWPHSSFLFLTAQVAGNHLHNGFPPATQPVGKGWHVPSSACGTLVSLVAATWPRRAQVSPPA